MSRQGFLGRRGPRPPHLPEIIASPVLQVAGPEPDGDCPHPWHQGSLQPSEGPGDRPRPAELWPAATNRLTEDCSRKSPAEDHGFNGTAPSDQAAGVALGEGGSR